ncbi:hypothetical protein Bca52824_025777 [Brassica carinata]|uniref:Uncharacterized protein n=1 Tax=Brassica carinata TaxID=52824 RepID=A0A8X7V875_BRACI|nr:hypothetical protein Bca52824_025777 [Brassica carinata]
MELRRRLRSFYRLAINSRAWKDLGAFFDAGRGIISGLRNDYKTLDGTFMHDYIDVPYFVDARHVKALEKADPRKIGISMLADEGDKPARRPQRSITWKA